MKTQISRRSFDARKRYSAVYQQQGRMVTDADWNELSEIAKRRLDAGLDDAIADGAPKQGGAGLVQAGPGQPVEVRAGRLYADGIGADAVAASDPEAATFALTDQADFPSAPAPPASSWIAYADVWERTVVSLEDPDQLRDAALHGADTCSRTQTMAQIKWCPAAQDPEDETVNPGRGDALLSAELRSNIEIEDPCDPCAVEVASEGTVGNYLFRLEVHDVEGDPAAPDRVVLKWSRENGAEQHALGTEPAGFAADNWQYEFYDDTSEKHLGVHLATGFTPSRGSLEAGFPQVPPGNPSYVRRWDGFCTLERDAGNNWSLADGRDRAVTLPQPGDAANPPHGFVQVTDRLVVHLERVRLELLLQNRVFVAGDYWLAPVREAISEAGGSLLDEAAPVGSEHHYLRLGSVDAAGSLEELETDRLRQLNFPPLSALEAGDVGYETACTGDGDNGIFDESHDTVEKALDRLCALDAGDVAFSAEPGCDALAGASTVEEALDQLCTNASLSPVSGDGQEAATDEFLPGPLQVRVAVGRFPVAGRQVQFSITRDDGGGELLNPANNESGRTLVVTTDGAGIAQVRWQLGADAPGTDVPPAAPGQRVRAVSLDNPALFVAFNAAVRGEAAVAPRVRIDEVSFVDGTPLENEMTVRVGQFAQGLRLQADDDIDPNVLETSEGNVTRPGRPNLELSLYLPYPLDDWWGTRIEPIAFQELVLAGEAQVSGQLLLWRPRSSTIDWLLQSLFQRLSELGVADRILVMLRLRGNFVWSEANPLMFVDADAFGRSEANDRVGLRLPSGDGVPGGLLESWFWIEPEVVRPSVDFGLGVIGNVISGTLTRQPGGALGDQRVELVLGTTGALRPETTNSQGRFTFTDVPNGTHTIRTTVGRETFATRARVGRLVGPPGRDILVTDTLVFDSREVEDQPLGTVRGVGDEFSSRLRGAGIDNATNLAMANPHDVSEALGVSLVRSRRIIRNARVTTFRRDR